MCQVLNQLLRHSVAMGDQASHPAAQRLGNTNVAAHRRLLAAARRGDAERVRKLMVEHIDEAERQVRKLEAVVRQHFLLDSELRPSIVPPPRLDPNDKKNDKKEKAR
jgi:DNA-binding GntR family transcriptional regulator